MKPSASAARNIPRPPSTYLKQFYYDTVNFNPKAIQLAIDFAGIDHIVAGSDYPHQIGSIPKMIETVGANADLYAANARRLLKALTAPFSILIFRSRDRRERLEPTS